MGANNSNLKRALVDEYNRVKKDGREYLVYPTHYAPSPLTPDITGGNESEPTVVSVCGKGCLCGCVNSERARFMYFSQYLTRLQLMLVHNAPSEPHRSAFGATTTLTTAILGWRAGRSTSIRGALHFDRCPLSRANWVGCFCYSTYDGKYTLDKLLAFSELCAERARFYRPHEFQVGSD
eukprot:6331364-Pyramimonas_sp.AAC.2